MASSSSTRTAGVARRVLLVAVVIVLVALYLARIYPVAAGLVAATGLTALWLTVIATCLAFAILTQRD